VKRGAKNNRVGFGWPGIDFARRNKKADRLKLVLLALAAIAGLLAPGARAQQQASANPETSLSDALSAACRQDSPAFANSLTSDNATAFRALPGAQRTAMMKRFVLLEEPGKPLLSTGSNGQKIVRCESPSFTTEMRLGETRVRENLAFVRTRARSRLAWCARAGTGNCSR
jgi:hypothetical protein